MEIIIKKNKTIISDDCTWFKVAPPKGKEKQWKDGYSAKELARFVTDGSKSFNRLIEKIAQSITGKTTESFEGIPEVTTSLPHNARGPRNHDLLLCNNDLVIGIEAKANESFGNSIYSEINNATSKDKEERIKWLMRTILGKPIDFDSYTKNNNTSKLKYQLFTATAGTLLEAASREIEKCVVLVLSFYLDKINRPNQKAFDEFVTVVCGDEKKPKTFILDDGHRITCWFKKINIRIYRQSYNIDD